MIQIFRNKTSVLDALTWHHYYLDGHTAKLQDFLSVQRLDYFSKMMKTIKRFLDKNGIKKPLWLGETSSAYGGGAHGLSDRYGMYSASSLVVLKNQIIFCFSCRVFMVRQTWEVFNFIRLLLLEIRKKTSFLLSLSQKLYLCTYYVKVKQFIEVEKKIAKRSCRTS